MALLYLSWYIDFRSEYNMCSLFCLIISLFCNQEGEDDAIKNEQCTQILRGR